MVTQEVLAQFIADGGYDTTCASLRAALKTQMHQMVDAVARHFPMGCRMSLPQGGMMPMDRAAAACRFARGVRAGAARSIGVGAGRGLLHHAPLRPLHPPAVRRTFTAQTEAAIRRLGQIVDGWRRNPRVDAAFAGRPAPRLRSIRAPIHATPGCASRPPSG